MPAITTWNRIELRTRADSPDPGLEARIHDPLWLLARQWQLGEFHGEDGGSPVLAEIEVEVGRVERFHAGPLAADEQIVGERFSPDASPLEAMVEREPVRAEPAGRIRDAAEAGLAFVRMLEERELARYRDGYVARFGFREEDHPTRSLDHRGARLERLVRGRLPDGGRLHEGLRDALRPPDGSAGALPDEPAVDDNDRAAVADVAREWLDWYESLVSEPTGDDAWQAERLEYAFAVGAPASAAAAGGGEVALVADAHRGERVDWHAFDLSPSASLGACSPLDVRTETAIPTPVEFRGMPELRYWAFEDARVDFGAIAADPDDVVRMLLVEFALVYGEDWFVVPVELPYGSVSRIRRLVVTDTFGAATAIDPTRSTVDESGLPEWEVYGLTPRPGPGGQPSPAPPLLYLASVLPTSATGTTLEEVAFVRDEMANLAWAVERSVEGGAGRPVHRRAELSARRPQAATGPLRYRLGGEVPAHWVPLIPRLTPDGLFLHEGALPSRVDAVTTVDGQGDPLGAWGRILTPGEALRIRDAQVPREGLEVRREYQLARAVDGSAHLWVARHTRVGRGEGRSGLRYDRLEAGEE